MLFAQLPPGFEEAITAASNRNWEAVVLVVLILTGFSFFGYMFRKFAEAAEQREQRLAGRVTHLEDLIRERLFAMIDANGQTIAKLVDATAEIVSVCRDMMHALQEFRAALKGVPCMTMELAQRMHLIDSIVDKSEGKRE